MRSSDDANYWQIGEEEECSVPCWSELVRLPCDCDKAEMG